MLYSLRMCVSGRHGDHEITVSLHVLLLPTPTKPSTAVCGEMTLEVKEQYQ